MISDDGGLPSGGIIGRSAIRKQIIDEHHPVANKTVVTDLHEFADKTVRLDSRTFSNDDPALDLNKRANKSEIADLAFIEICGLNYRHIFAKLDVANRHGNPSYCRSVVTVHR